MRKKIYSAGLLALAFAANAQILSYVGDGAQMYVSKDALVYNGGGMQVVGTGLVENHGNVMVVGSSSDTFTTGDTSTNFINKLNEPANYGVWSTNDSTSTPSFTYGQFYISGIPQNNITGSVSEEYRAVNHGAYQQFAMPFYGKSASTLSSELGKTFSTTRWSQNEILVWNNSQVVFDNLNSIDASLGADLSPFSYFILGGASLDVSNTTRVLKGRPVSDVSNFQLQLSGAGAGINFGTSGTALNKYQERYNSYLGDAFSIAQGYPAWDGTNFGKNLYFIANPYLTNLDLKNLATSGDTNFLSNIYGIRLEPTNVQYKPGQGGSIVNYKYVTIANGVLSGDVEYLMVRPMGTFMIKLKDNSATPTLKLSDLRRFNYYSRSSGTAYSVSASKSGNAKVNGTVKELAVIGLNATGGEVARTYYVLYPGGVSGHSQDVSAQVSNANGSILGTFEENPIEGGYDTDYTSKYWLYINEANDTDFIGKNIKLAKYSDEIVSFKIQIKENGELIPDGQQDLSSSLKFYLKTSETDFLPLAQNQILSAGSKANQSYDIFYGKPGDKAALATNDIVVPRTMIVYNPEISSYIIKFDPTWKRANVSIYDLSGKLILQNEKISASQDYNLSTNSLVKGVYIVRVISETGAIAQTKIIR